MRKKITIIGWGNMGAAIGEALAEENWQVFFFDKDKSKLISRKNITACPTLLEAIEKAKILILAIKPQDIPSFLKEAKKYLKDKLLISIAAGVSTKFFQKYLENTKVVRVMPNLAAKKRLSISFISKGIKASEKDLELACKIFSCVGDVVKIEENWLDKVTAISGSGPGYLYYLLHLFYKSAISLGFKKELAKRMIKKTFLGATRLIEDSSLGFKEWFEKVASRGGTTQAAVEEWRKNHLEEIIKKGIKRAVKRAQELNLK